MTTQPKAQRSSTETDAAATDWVVRLRGKLTSALWDQFEEWRESDPRNHAAYLAQEQSWVRLQQLVKKLRREGTATLTKAQTTDTASSLALRGTKTSGRVRLKMSRSKPRTEVTASRPDSAEDAGRTILSLSSPASEADTREVVSIARQPVPPSTASSPPVSKPVLTLETFTARLLSNLTTVLSVPQNTPRGESLALPPVKALPARSNLLLEAGMVWLGRAQTKARTELLPTQRPVRSSQPDEINRKLVFALYHHALPASHDDLARATRDTCVVFLFGHAHGSGSPPVTSMLHGQADSGELGVRAIPVHPQSSQSDRMQRLFYLNACASTETLWLNSQAYPTFTKGTQFPLRKRPAVFLPSESPDRILMPELEASWAVINQLLGSVEKIHWRSVEACVSILKAYKLHSQSLGLKSGHSSLLQIDEAHEPRSVVETREYTLRYSSNPTFEKPYFEDEWIAAVETFANDISSDAPIRTMR